MLVPFPWFFPAFILFLFCLIIQFQLPFLTAFTSNLVFPLSSAKPAHALHHYLYVVKLLFVVNNTFFLCSFFLISYFNANKLADAFAWLSYSSRRQMHYLRVILKLLPTCSSSMHLLPIVMPPHANWLRFYYCFSVLSTHRHAVILCQCCALFRSPHQCF